MIEDAWIMGKIQVQNNVVKIQASTMLPHEEQQTSTLHLQIQIVNHAEHDWSHWNQLANRNM